MLPSLPAVIEALSAFVQTELGRLLLTLSVFGSAMLSLRIVHMRARYSGAGNPSFRRGNFVLAKNLVLLVALVAIGTIWASKIAGAALSVAAVAGAVLIVGKEFLANLLGSALLAITRPYSIGAYIELDGISGRVVDSDMLATTLAETQQGSQVTGRTVTLPHALLLSKPVRNLTATGDYVINMITVAVDPASDIPAHDKALLDAAKSFCEGWQSSADAYLLKVESRDLVDLPSAQPKVILELDDAKETKLTLRYPCRPNDRVKVEQGILREYIARRPATVA